METHHITFSSQQINTFYPMSVSLHCSEFYYCPTWGLSLQKYSLPLHKWAVIPPYFRPWYTTQFCR